MGPSLLSPGIVLDASIVLAWCLPDESEPYADGIIARLPLELGHVPSIWALEVANALVIGHRRGRFDVAVIEASLADLDQLPLQYHELTASETWDAVCPIAVRHQISIYDACYISLALKLGAPLATLDQRLMAVAQLAGVPAA